MAAGSVVAPAYSAIARIGPGADRVPGPSMTEKAEGVAKNFESVFLNSMFQQMFTGIEGDGPFGGGVGGGVWRSFLAEEYAKSFANAGGVGIGKEVYRTLLEMQEAAAK
jgi:Rod binding domain-containing protein